MSFKLNLVTKFVLLSVGLVIIPLSILGSISLWSINNFTSDLSLSSGETLQKEAVTSLETNNSKAKDLIASLVDSFINDTLKIAHSGNLDGYLRIIEGRNEQWNSIIGKEAKRAVAGIAQVADTQEKLLKHSLATNLKVAQRILDSHGEISYSDKLIRHEAINQFTQSKVISELPALRIGGTVLNHNTSPRKTTFAVDEIANLVGGAVTIFQRMNSEGDMLRVATNIKTLAGKRAVDTFIPALNPDGSPNAVIATVQNGETFLGRAFVVNEWYVTAYKPILDSSKNTIGMLFVGLPEQSNKDLANSIVNAKLGADGYSFIMDKKGVLLIHPNPSLIGKDVIKDLNISEFSKLIADSKQNEFGLLSYSFEGRSKFVAYTYFPQWDWIICSTGYWDEVMGELADGTKKSLYNELESYYKISQITTKSGRLPLYRQIRFISADGQELLKLVDGRLSESKISRRDESWFKKAVSLKQDETYVAHVEISTNTGKPELRTLTPVYIDGRVKGVVALNVDWDITREFFSDTKYGKSGYPYIIDSSGTIITHPKYTLQDRINLGDSKYGELATLVKEKMTKGASGSAAYTFEGSEELSVFSPFTMGDFSYTVVAVQPLEEALEISGQIARMSNAETSKVRNMIILSVIVMTFLGCIVGYLVSRGISRPLLGIIKALTAITGHTAGAADQVSHSSQNLASGASQQAAAIQQTSASLEQMGSVTEQTAENAKEASSMAHNVSKEVVSAVHVMKDALSAMKQIENSSSQMAKIISSIDEIAFQTNLLALNAAVEAARAGDAGRGFAVVAEEVRSLAGRSANAAKDTASLIEEAQKSSSSGAKSINLLSTYLNSIQANMDSAVSTVEKIAVAAKEQACGIHQVSKAVSEIDKVVQGNASSSEESAAASQELTSQTMRLEQMINELGALVGDLNLKEAKES